MSDCRATCCVLNFSYPSDVSHLNDICNLLNKPGEIFRIKVANKSSYYLRQSRTQFGELQQCNIHKKYWLTLNLSTIKCPMLVHIMFNWSFRFTIKRVEIFSLHIRIHELSESMFSDCGRFIDIDHRDAGLSGRLSQLNKCLLVQIL